MKEQAIKKINKVGKISNIVTLICKILVIIGLVFSLLGAVVCFVIPESLVKVTTATVITTEIDFSELGMQIPQEQLDELEQIQSVMEEGDLQVDYVQNGVLNGQLALESSKETYIPTNMQVTANGYTVEAHSGDVTMSMRDVAVLLMIASVALVMTLVTLFFIGGLCKAFRDCASPFEENVIKKMQNLAIALIPWTVISTLTDSILTSLTTNSMQWSVSLDMGVILVVLVVLILVYIFKYGAVLQQESDETL